MVDACIFSAIPSWLSAPLDALPAWMKPALLAALAAGVAALGWRLLAIGFRAVAPKLAAIAATTRKEALSQPLFYVLLAIGVFALVAFPFLPGNTFGDDIRVLKEDGLTLIKILAIILTLWTSSSTIAEEIEGRTALTLLSKPITRRQFIVGKFLGLLGPVLIMFLILGVVFLAGVSFKVVFDARETASPPPTWRQCGVETLQIAPGLLLALMETTMITAISVAVSTRLGVLPNLLICSAAYALGHLAPLALQSAAGQIAPVHFVAWLFATILPALEHFNIDGAIAAGASPPWDYMAWAAGYCALYSATALLLALLLFEDRDLA